ncbi:MAG: hypothetical protein KGJ47_10605 [Acidobacteriota bacterium]|nr:hypothetical protein [Acidobacteriota bacterium]
MPRRNSRGIGRVSYLLISVYVVLLVAALVNVKMWSSPSVGGATSAATTTTLPATSFGANGVVSRAIINENALPGTTSWQIPAGTSPTAIQGFANATNAQVGQNVDFYVTTQDPTYHLEAYRMGWYQGKGARLIWTSQLQHGINQPACPVDTSVNMVTCYNWKISAVMLVSQKFVPGDYLIKLVAGPTAMSYIPLTIWDPTSTSTYVVVNRSMVEQGWNTYGGFSFYAGTGPCIIDSSSYPVCNRARVVSFDRPYDTGYGSSDFLTNEYPLVALMEKEGLDVSYITDITLATYPNVLAHHKVLISLDHDETWTYEERVALQNAQAHGLNVVFFGAAAMVRHARLEPSILGLNRQVVDYRNSYEDPLNGKAAAGQVTGNTWESPPASWSPLPQIGVQYSGYLAPNVFVPMVVSDAKSWVFQNTGLTNGSSLPNVIASDFDHVIASNSEPANLDVLGHSPIPVNEGTASGTTWNGVSYSDMVYFTNPVSHAGTIDTGNNVWVGDLNRCTTATDPTCAAPALITITNNILRLFGRGPAGLYEPSVSNVASIVPAGS